MISITLPSIYPDALEATLRNIFATTTRDYEVIVVGPKSVGLNALDRARVVWVEEEESRGCAHAHHVAALHASGDYLVPFADDHEFARGWSEVAMEEFERRATVAPFALGLRGAHSNHVGTNWGVFYPYFPMMRRADVERVGWIGPDYRAGFGDSDLAMRVWNAGGRCEWSDAGLLRPTASDKRKEHTSSRRPAAAYAPSDFDLFVSRWGDRYGAGWSSASIDDFNIDLRPEENPWACEGNTIYRNDPAFARNVRRMNG